MRYVFLTLISVVVVGCGSSAEVPELVPVTGIATRGGKPVANLEIIFQPTGGGRASTGNTGEDGKFTLMYTRDEPGAIPGSHTVSVRHLAATPEEQAKPPQPYAAILAKYGPGAQSPLTVTAEEGASDVEIKLD